MSVITQFARIAHAVPTAIALETTGRALTYLELDARSAAWALALQRAGVQPGGFVVFALERSIEAIVLQLAVLRVGAVCVPLDPSAPAARWERVLETMERPVVLRTDAALAELARARAWPVVAWPLDVIETAKRAPVDVVGEDAPAYVRFTSGSTGEPHGVLIPHRGIVRLVCDVPYVRLGP
ncbi:MAG: AMP-binding protein, partial [Gemmatimonadaceae bacterium]|nr:AMP-binding protein [Gemmatimonadaceae bacterium]